MLQVNLVNGVKCNLDIKRPIIIKCVTINTKGGSAGWIVIVSTINIFYILIEH